MNKESFGKFFKELRLKKNYTQLEVADLLFVDVSAVSKWERGVSYPDITLIPRICEVLDVDEHELIKSSYDPEYRRIKEEGIKFINIKNRTFWTMTFLYVIAIAVCFIVNICVDKTLSWFFIVFSSCLTGFMFFPTCTRFFKKNKFLVFLISTFLSLCILFLTCSIYTNDYWWLVASMGTFLGYFLIFYPIVYKKNILYLNDNYDRNKKYFLITYALGLLLSTTLLLFVINAYVPINIGDAIVITLYCFVILIVYGIVSLFNINKYYKLSICSLFTVGYFIGLVKVLITVLGEPDQYSYRVNFNDWINYTNGNIMFIVCAILILLSILFLVLGLDKKDGSLVEK